MSVDKWLGKALTSLEREDWYDSLESFQGALFRAMRQNNFEEAQELFRRAITKFEEYSLEPVFFRKLGEYFLQLSVKIGRKPQTIAIVYETGRSLIENEKYAPAITILKLFIQRSEDDVKDVQETIAHAYEKLAEISAIENDKILLSEQAGLYYVYSKVEKGQKVFNRLAAGGDVKHGSYAVITALIADDIAEGDAILKGMATDKGFLAKRRLGKDAYYSFTEQAKDTYQIKDTATYQTLLNEYRHLLAQDPILDRLSKILLKKFPKIEPQGFPGFPGMPFGGGMDFPPDT